MLQRGALRGDPTLSRLGRSRYSIVKGDKREREKRETISRTERWGTNRFQPLPLAAD